MERVGQPDLRAVDVSEFVRLTLPPRELIVAPFLPTRGLAMVHAARGVGKTHFALSIACAVAGGRDFLTFKVPKPTGVLYIDGEMPAALLQERMRLHLEVIGWEPSSALRIVTPDLQPAAMPDLATEEGRTAVEALLNNDVELLVLDSLSTLIRSGKENEAESWEPIQSWLLRLRGRGISVLLIHHSGKHGTQRGTSKREDVLDTVIKLTPLDERRPETGAAFEIRFTKARDMFGTAGSPVEARLLTGTEGQARWETQTAGPDRRQRVAVLLSEGRSAKQIMTELGISKATFYRDMEILKSG